jgi:hypothetical protein
MPTTSREVARLIKAIEGTRKIIRLIDERMALKLSKIDGVVHEGVYYHQNVIPIKQVIDHTCQVEADRNETIGSIYTVVRSSEPEHAVVRFDFCCTETDRGTAWVADAIDIPIKRAALYITAKDVIDTVQEKIAVQTVKYHEKINNMRRVNGMLEWLRTGDPYQFNVPVTR